MTEDKITKLKQDIFDLEEKVGGVRKVVSYLQDLEQGRKQSFAYTNKIPDEQEFEFSGVVDGVGVSINIPEGFLLKELQKNNDMQELSELKEKLHKVEKLLEGL